ncbi:MAG: hypothetical protein H3C62_15250 [Gemmatimonadaceae bacterium]|nr:hypothetical protein [Gemmatimonadaceae bacterium]
MPAYLSNTVEQITRADELEATAREVPSLLLQIALQPGLPLDRRLEFATYMASAAADESTNAESALNWYLALEAILASFVAAPADATEALQALRWRAFEMAVRAGLVVEAEVVARAALAVGPMPAAQVKRISTWTHTLAAVELVLALLPELAHDDSVQQTAALLETQRAEYANERALIACDDHRPAGCPAVARPAGTVQRPHDAGFRPDSRELSDGSAAATSMRAGSARATPPASHWQPGSLRVRCRHPALPWCDQPPHRTRDGAV